MKTAQNSAGNSDDLATHEAAHCEHGDYMDSCDIEPAKRKRLPGRPFKPGVSGNPGGRPKTPPELVEAFQARTEKALATLDKIMDDYESDKMTMKGDPWVPASAAAKAAEVVLARGWGAPPVKVDLAADVKVEGKVEVQQRLVIDPEKMRRVAAVLLRAGVLKLEGT